MYDSFGLIEKLQKEFENPLRGYEFQKFMEPPLRNTFSLDHATARKAATLLPLYFDKEWKFILIRRSGNPLDKHKGQISFPGGSLELDELPEDAALREANEEIGLHIDSIELIGKLSNLFIPVSNFIINPFVGMIDSLDINTLIKQDAEVDEILHFNLRDLLEDDNVKVKPMKTETGLILEDVPYFDLDNYVIWGATAMILSEFKQILKNV